MNPKLTSKQLSRKAIVYVRQSTPGQVSSNKESQRRQYALEQRARGLGFREVVVVDQDLGRSGSGSVERPGFQRIVAEVCAGDVGAVLALEASRLARNGRDWHQLIDLCALRSAVLIDHDGIYDPRRINDRLLLGLKGTMSEFELSTLRLRAQQAILQKAKRGELRMTLPIGFCRRDDGAIEIDPDKRVQQAIHLVFQKFESLGSVRQVMLWFGRTKSMMPAARFSKGGGRRIVWKCPNHVALFSILKNPIYAGAYAFGKTESRTSVTDGQAKITRGHRRQRDRWEVLIQNQHEGYIPWEQFEQNQLILAENAHRWSKRGRKAGRGGRGLLTGLVRCRRCGRMLDVSYRGRYAKPYYKCLRAHIQSGAKRCISFGSKRVEKAIADDILCVIEEPAIEAAFQAAELIENQHKEQRRAIELELEQARYEVQLTQRRYEQVDPDNRLVADELETRWNIALERAADVEQRLSQFDVQINVPQPAIDRRALLALASDLPAVWHDDSTDMRLKQRIVRLLIQEVVADIDHEKDEIVLVIHWTGGRHSERRVPRTKTGDHSRCTDRQVIEVVRQLARRYPDMQIAATLNRMGVRTGAGNTWDARRVRSLRHYHKVPCFDPKSRDTSMVTLTEAAQKLGISLTGVRSLISRNLLEATQIAPRAPWQIPAHVLESKQVKDAVTDLKARRPPHMRPRSKKVDTQTLTIPGLL